MGIGCASGDADSGKLSVVATTTQIGDFARQVGGDAIKLTVILQPNQDAHDFEARASQLRAISDADLVLRNGLHLDSFVTKATGQAKGITVVVTEGISIRTGGEEGHEEEADHEEEAEHEADPDDREGDPHVWMSVENAKAMVVSIRDALIEADDENAAMYRENAGRYLAELDSLDAEIRREVATIPAACRKLVTNHGVLGYYAEEYGLALVGSVIPGASSAAEPSAADVKDIVAKIGAEKVPTIFAEASINPDLIRQVGREAGVNVVDDLYGDSLGPKDSDGGTYLEMMRTNTEKIVAGLKNCS
jgi:zinc/manganese transport system substrate-binding protein/manganese/iron transport system substrate-binding protein